MASRIKSRQTHGHKSEPGDYRISIGIFSALVFLAWMIIEITLRR